MAEVFEYGETDKTKLVYSMILFVFICCISFILSNDLKTLLLEGGANSSSEWVPSILIAIFRTICAYLAIHSLFFWMALDKKGGFMYAHFHTEKESLPHRMYGIERWVPFSSWNLIIFGLAFISFSLLSWFEVLGQAPPQVMHIIASILLSASLGMATITASVVTYFIIPKSLKMRENSDYLFEKHQMVMHNWVIILIFTDIVLTIPSLSWMFFIFGVSIGVIYVAFAYLFARFGGGYYVYQFIDPRIKFAPIIMLLLALMIGGFYLLVWFALKILEWNYIIGVFIFIGWVYSNVVFKSPKKVQLMDSN